MAYGLEGLRDSRLERTGTPAPPAVPSLWNPAVVGRVLVGDSSRLLSVDPVLLTRQGKRRPVWLVTRSTPPGRIVVSAVADHQVSASRGATLLSGG